MVARCGLGVYADVEWYILKLPVVDGRRDGVDG